jgi:hypothetical protein
MGDELGGEQMSLIEEQTRLPSSQFGAWEPSYDVYPDERRWAKRFALYRLRSLIRNLTRHYDVVIVQDLSIVHHAPELDCPTRINMSPYTWGWKCRFILANKP